VQVLGASWYVASIQRQYDCWIITCKTEMNKTHSPSCNPSFLDCTSLEYRERQAWFKHSRVLSDCDALNNKNEFQFGLFADAFTDHVSSSRFVQKYFYCLWWGLKNLRYIHLPSSSLFPYLMLNIIFIWNWRHRYGSLVRFESVFICAVHTDKIFRLALTVVKRCFRVSYA